MNAPTLSLTTDYAAVSTGSPEPYLQQIGAAGFSHTHWCHQWNTDFLYSRAEIAQIGKWLKQYGVQLLDLHASAGVEKGWAAAREYERRAGVELVKNRIEMTARLGADVIIMHIPMKFSSEEETRLRRAQLRKSLDSLQPYARRHAVRIAIENGLPDSFPAQMELFAAYPPDYLGLCYDSGHGNIGGDGLAKLDAVKDRLISVHLHDNDGTQDQHRLPFDGTVDWPRLTRILAASSYRKCVSLESNTGRYENKDEALFLPKAFQAAKRLSEMVAEERGRHRGA